MATLRLPAFSCQYIMNNNGTISGGLTDGVGYTHPSIISGGNLTGMSLLIIYKGTIENFATFTDRSTRAADVLITFALPGSNNAWQSLGIVNQSARYLFGRHLPNQAASASGTASWFLMCRAGTTTLTDKGALIGSVGITGSGADLEIPSLSIVSAQNYQSAGFYLNMPQNWTI